MRQLTKEWLINALGLQEVEFSTFYAELIHRHPYPFQGMASLGFSVQDYYKNVFEKLDPYKHLLPDKKLQELLKRLKVPKYVVTLAQPDYSRKVQKALEIADLLDGVLFMADFKEPSKLAAYEAVSKKLAIAPENICVVGDNFEIDILPAISAGYKTVLISEEKRTETRSIKSVYDLLTI